MHHVHYVVQGYQTEVAEGKLLDVVAVTCFADSEK